MKKISIITAILFGSLAVHAQTDTTKIEQYCQLIATQKILSNKVSIDIDFGEEKSFWRDNRLKTYDGKIKKFNTIIDAMNYMAKDGWIFIDAFPVHIGESEIYHFGFKKQFRRSDIEN